MQETDVHSYKDVANIRIVLIKTFHPGNIGSIARAMKTMGLNNLYLVSPVDFPHNDADKMAVSAKDILTNCTKVSTLEQAIHGCTLVIGTSSRQRSEANYRPMLTTEATAVKLVSEACHSPVALIFGQETMGLTNDELQKCHFHAYIDSNPVYPVLNIAAAAQIFCYEIYKSLITKNYENKQQAYPKTGYPTAENLEDLYQHLEQCLYDIDFIARQHPGNIINHLKKILMRARLDNKDLNILRGILTKMQQLIAKK